MIPRVIGNVRLVLCALVWTIAVWAVPAAAYEEISVTDGGSIVGTVVLSGEVPKPKGYNLTTLPDPIYCGRISDGQGWRLLQPFNVGLHGAFQQVVVRVEGVEKGKPFEEFTPPRIEAKDCRFMPFVNVVRDQHDVTVVNLDPAMHDIQAYETSRLGPRVLFNVPLPISSRYPQEAGLSAHFHKHYQGEPVTQTVKMTKGRQTFVMQCGFHAYMESWAMVVDDPYFAITDQDGRFEITDIPPGTYRVTLWHPYVREPYERTVTVRAKEPVEVEMTVAAPTGRLYANQMVENAYIRYTITEEAQSQIVPTLEKQSY